MRPFEDVSEWVERDIKSLYPNFTLTNPSTVTWRLEVSNGIFVTVHFNRANKVVISGIKNGWFMKEEFYFTWQPGRVKDMTKLAKTKINAVLKAMNTPI